MKRIITLIFVYFFGINTFAQIVTTCATDTIKLRTDNHQYGTLEWETSIDNENWTKIANAQDSVYKFKPTKSAYYRAVNKFSNCDPIISSTTLVQKIPTANAGIDRIVNDNFTYLFGNITVGAVSSWSVIEGTGGVFESPNSPISKFTGIRADGTTTGPQGIYKVKYTLSNDCGVSSDTITVKLIHNQYYDKLVIVDETDVISSTEAQIENGEYVITFGTPVPIIDNETILVAMVGDGFMRKVTSFTQTGNTFSMQTSQAKLEDVLVKGGLELGKIFGLDPIRENLKTSNYKKLRKIPTRADLLTDKSLKTGTHYFVLDEKIETPLKGLKISQESRKISDYKSSNKILKNTVFEEKFILYNFDGTTLYDKNGINAKLDGNLTFSPNIEGDVDVDWVGLEVTKANIGVKDATLDFKSKLTIIATTAGETETEQLTLATIKKKLIILVAGVPTLIQIKTQLNAFVKLSATGTATYVNDYNKTYKVNAGVIYDNGIFSNYYTDSESSSMSDDIKANASVTSTVDFGPKIFFTINGLAGPYIDAQMTSDLTLCASTQNFQDFNWGVNLDLGAKLTAGIHAYMFKKKLFDKSKTWQNRKLFNEKTPYRMEFIKGNNQQYTIGSQLADPLQVKVSSKQGLKSRNILVTFEVLDESGTVSQKQVFTDDNGIAQTYFTPSSAKIAQVKAFVKNCEFNFIQNAPLIFSANENIINNENCSQSTLSASFAKQFNTLTLIGHLGTLPYTYSTDLINFSNTVPNVEIVTGNNYHYAVKDASGCVAFAHYYQSETSCADTDLSLNVELYGKNAIATAQNGKPPYTYALNNGDFEDVSIFTNLANKDYLIRVKDSNNCVRQSIITVTNSTSDLLAYFEIPAVINANKSFKFINLSANATSFLWDFGDGTTSTVENAVKNYTTPGNYNVTLTAFEGTNQHIFIKTITVTNAINSITEGLVAYYPFNGNANDESGNNNHGVINGAVFTTDRNGATNKSLYFNTSNVAVPNSTSLQFANNVSSWSFWIKLDDPTGTPNCIWAKSGDIGGNVNSFVSINSDSTINTWASMPSAKVTTVPNSDYKQWIHITNIFDESSSQTKTYVNGNLIATDALQFSHSSSNQSPLFFGYNDVGGFPWYLYGKLDDIRIYNRVLSDAEVSQIYYTEFNPKTPTDGLVAYYPFNGNANDESGNDNNGTVNGATLTTDRFGKSAKAYSFDGVDDNILINNSPSLQNIDEITISAWVNYTDLASDGSIPIVDKSNNITGGQYFLRLFNNGNNSLHGTLNGQAGSLPFTGIKVETWYHLIMVVESNNFSFYLNGQLIGSTSGNGTGFSNSMPLTLGANPSGLLELLNGKLDEIRIYKQALTPQQVTNLYYSEKKK